MSNVISTMNYPTQRQVLEKLVQGPKIPQALLFTGQQGLGQKQTALAFIKLLHGGQIQQVDFVEISPEKKEIQIGQIRDLQRFLSLKAQTAPVKAVLISQAHTLNQASQNCLLKTLEEPLGQTLFILISHLPDLLLPTVRSRCQIIRFYPQEEKLGSFPKELTSLLNSSLTEKFNFAKKFIEQNKENLTESITQFLDGFTIYLRASLLQAIGINQQSPGLCAVYSLKKIKAMLKTVDKTKQLISSTNVNQRLALENLMLEI